jgi:ABC-type lipoprotein release transport system permease subunit
MGALLYGITATDPPTLALAPAVLIAAAAVAIWFPAWRGAQVPPVEVLRAE